MEPSWPRHCSLLPPDTHNQRLPARRQGETLPMSKLTAVLVLIASFLLLAPVIESGTPTSVPVFQAVGNACEGGGGW